MPAYSWADRAASGVLLFLPALAVPSLARAADTPQLVSPARQIVVRVSAAAFAQQLERPIDEMLAVDEVVLGVRAVGRARVQAQPTLLVVDDANLAAFTVSLVGTIASQTVGRKGPVTLHSRSQSHFTATKRVVFRPGQGFVGDAALVVAHTTSNPERIVPDRGGVLGRAIERRAWERVAHSRDQVNQIVRARTEDKIRDAFDRLLSERLAGANCLAQQRLLIALALNASGSPAYACSTRAGFWQIAASSSADEITFDLPRDSLSGPPVQLFIHQRVLGERTTNFLRQFALARSLLERLLLSQRPAANLPVALVNPPFLWMTCGEWIVVCSGHGETHAAATQIQRLAEVRSAP